MSKTSGREMKYDIVRVISTLAVIILHVGWDFCGYGADVNSKDFFGGCILVGITRFAVPCYLMISGAFLLKNQRNLEWRAFYNKSWNKLGIPLLQVSVIYVLYYYARNVVYIILNMPQKANWIEPLYHWMIGMPGKHLWYMYMLILLYILVPWLIRVKNELTPKQWKILGIVLACMGIISQKTSWYTINWGLDSIRYVGYLLLGNIIYESVESGKSSFSILFLIFGISGFALLGPLYYYIRQHSYEKLYDIGNPLSFYVVAFSVVLFIGITGCPQVKYGVSQYIVDRMYYVYLLQELVKKLIFNAGMLTVLGMNIKPVWGGVMVAAMIFAVSYCIVLASERSLRLCSNIRKKDGGKNE